MPVPQAHNCVSSGLLPTLWPMSKRVACQQEGVRKRQPLNKSESEEEGGRRDPHHLGLTIPCTIRSHTELIFYLPPNLVFTYWK